MYKRLSTETKAYRFNQWNWSKLLPQDLKENVMTNNIDASTNEIWPTIIMFSVVAKR